VYSGRYFSRLARNLIEAGEELMKTLHFSNGDQMPIVGLGTWKSAPGEVYAAVREAIRIGYRHIDCALVYGNETEIGNALRDAIGEGQVTRKELWITSKLWNNSHGRENVGAALRKSLQDLGLAYLDLYLIHWPIPLKPSAKSPISGADFLLPAEAPIQSTWEGMEAAVTAGLTRHIGVSNFSAKKLRDIIEHCKIKPEVDQVEMHPLLQQPELVKFCAAHGIHMTAWAPLGSSDRPDSVKAANAPVLLENPVIKSIAQGCGCTPAQILIAWHVNRGISVIPKSVTPSRLRENLAAAQIVLNPADMARIAALDQNYRLIDGSFWVKEGSPWTLQTIWDAP
jgi:alcohol dehydrogenase (NADP+)